MGILCKLCIGRTHGGHEAMDLVGVLDAPQRFAIGAITFYAGTDVNGQGQAARTHLHDAIGHVCRRESTT